MAHSSAQAASQGLDPTAAAGAWLLLLPGLQAACACELLWWVAAAACSEWGSACWDDLALLRRACLQVVADEPPLLVSLCSWADGSHMRSSEVAVSCWPTMKLSCTELGVVRPPADACARSCVAASGDDGGAGGVGAAKDGHESSSAGAAGWHFAAPGPNGSKGWRDSVTAASSGAGGLLADWLVGRVRDCESSCISAHV